MIFIGMSMMLNILCFIIELIIDSIAIDELLDIEIDICSYAQTISF